MKTLLKTVFREITPPIFYKIAKKNYSNRSFRLYGSYDEALKYSSLKGYETDEIVKVVVEKNKIYADKLLHHPYLTLNDLRTVIGIGLTKVEDKVLNVLDFGGGGGAHYYIAKIALGENIKIRWNVVETEALANQAQCLKTDDLKFFSTIEDACLDLGRVDLVFSSGALQYTPDPIFYLSKLLEVGAKNFFITRTSFSANETKFIGVQESKLSANGPGALPKGFQDFYVYYPNVFVPKSEVEQLIANFNYKINLHISEDRQVYKFGDQCFDMYGFFCEQNQ